MNNVVIVGGGHAAAALCGALKEGGYTGRIVLVSEESHLPYHRPPLSKSLLKDPGATLPELRGASFYEQAGIEVRLGTRAIAIDRNARCVHLQPLQPQGQGETLAYDHLVLATGARARVLPGLQDDVSGVHVLRQYDEAVRLREALGQVRKVIVLGGGFIGLEAAASARQLGKEVTVIEAGNRLLARAVSPQVSDHLLQAHRALGVDLRLGHAPERVEFEAGRFEGVRVAGEFLAAELLLVGIGGVPETSLAAAAALRCDNGIVVDERLATEDPHISAIGDCTSFPYLPGGGRLRLESVQNANDQAKTLAARLLGREQSYEPVPWFWSDQGEVRLQIAGLWRTGLKSLRREGSKPGSFSVAHFDEAEKLVAVESINAAPDHMVAKRWLQQQYSPALAGWMDASQPLKNL